MYGRLLIEAINVNSMNTSTLHCNNSKTYLKVEGVTGLKPDIILLSDCRLNKGHDKVGLLFNLNQNGGYKTIFNSSKESRGVGIAIRNDLEFDLISTFKDEETENYLIIKAKIRGHELAIGVIYGPNHSDRNFFINIKNICDQLGCSYILGGDFNTILDQQEHSLDRIGEGRVPNKINGQELNRWIREGTVIEPYRFFFPGEREVSYIPFRTRRTINNVVVEHEYNQTRLDFFLVSTTIIDCISKVYYENRLGRDFDHKPVMLELGKSTTKYIPSIRHGTLDDITANIEGKIGIYELISAHLVEINIDLNRVIGRLEVLIREKRKIIWEGEGDRSLETVDDEIEAELINLPGMIDLLNNDFTCDKRTLYEVTMMGLKNRLLNLQIILDKQKRAERDNLTSNVHRSKRQNGIESLEYKQSLDRLLTYEDNKLKQRAGKFRDFFDKNVEKGTKAFCRLGKNYTKGDNLDRIKMQNGGDFSNDKDRINHIRDFWSDIYKKRLDRLIKIEDFLTVELSRSERVSARKLTEDEKESIDGPVSMEELEKSLKMSNMNSACGWDGLSYRVLAKFWADIGPIMTEMANESFREGLMTDSFRTGVLRLLPKKTDSSKVENWRPITLLSCGYKVLSGMVANRIEIFLPKIIGRAQKGFLRHKNINTVTVNIIDNIAKSINTGEELGVLCIDFIKAFDSVEHSCMESTLRFFNFGENFVNMVMTILRERKTMIKLENGYADSFPITRGTPQGDRTSPYIFILVVELLLMKLEHARGGGLISCNYMGEYENMLGGENCVCECYADDLTVLFKYSDEGLSTILDIMKNFELTTGLGMNKKKTNLMITNTQQYQGEVRGITLCDEVTVLGIVIDRKLEKIQQNWDKAIIKTKKLIQFWRNFNLSITGRIMVSKTYLLPQSIYYMNTLPMGEEVGNELNKHIIGYISGSDRKIARERWFAAKEKGGYGMIDCTKLNIAIKCNWLKRWQKEINSPDLPIMITMKGDINNLERITMTEVEKDYNPCSYGILAAWRIFLQQFYKYDKNWKNATCWGNIALASDIGFGKTIFTDVKYDRIRNRYGGMKTKELLDGDVIKNKGDMELIIGDLTWQEYNKIRTIINRWCRNTIHTNVVNLYTTIQELMHSVTKGCRKFRDYIDGKKSDMKNISVNNIPSLITLWGEIGNDDTQLVEFNLRLWGIGGLSPEYKDFLFRMLHGRLYLNSVRANFDDISPKCTFCLIAKKRDLGNRNLTIVNLEWVQEIENLPNETIWHLLKDCTIVNEVLTNFFVRELNVQNIDNWYKMGYIGTSIEQTTVRLLVIHWAKFYIYKCRCIRQIPVAGDMRYEFEVFVEKLKALRELRPFVRQIRVLFT